MSPHVAEMNALERAFRREVPRRMIQTLSINKQLLSVIRLADSCFLPHLVILEFDMYGINGIDVLREREKYDYWLNVPFVVLTDQFDQRVLDYCRQSGADNTIPKPALLGDYISLIGALSDAIKSTSDESMT